MIKDTVGASVPIFVKSSRAPESNPYSRWFTVFER